MPIDVTRMPELRSGGRAAKHIDGAAFAETLDALPQMAWTALPSGHITFCNRYWLQYTGLSPEQVAGDGWAQALHPEDASSTREKWSEATSSDCPYQVEQRLRAADGSYRWFLTRATPLRDADGQVIQWLGVCIDIHDRKLAEESQRASELALQHRLAELQTIYSTAPVGLCFHDAQLRFVSINHVLAQINGLPVEEHLGRSLTEVKPAIGQQVEQYLRRVVETGQPIVDLELVYPSGQANRFALASYYPVKDEAGQVVGVNAVVQDITDRKQADLQLRESEERFRTLADNIAQLAWMADETGSIFWYNKRWFDYTGTTHDAMQGWGWQAVHHPDHVGRVTEKFRQCVANGEFWEDTFPIRGQDGTYRWFLSRAIPIRGSGGQVLRWFGTNTDVTQQRKIEDALKEADRRKNHFLALLGHELRNPLAGITSGIEVLRLLGGGGAQADEIRAAITRQAGQMKHLIDDLLDVARITSGRISLRNEPIELVALIRDTIEDQRRTLAENHCLPEIELPDQPLWVRGDRTRLAQIVNNLVQNACKFTDREGRVTVDVSRVGQQAQIVVRDSGVGISPEVMARLFEPFAQAPESERRGGGLGLGLALVKGLVELHGGIVSASSAGQGSGAEFVVLLPLVDHEVDSPASIAQDSARLQRVLVVDDLPDTLLPLRRLLELEGHQVAVATSGAEAVAAAQANPPDVILCDIGLPDGMSGYDVARAVRADQRLRQIYLVALTGYGQEHDRIRARQAGFDYHVTKPLSGEMLARLLAESPRFEAD